MALNCAVLYSPGLQILSIWQAPDLTVIQFRYVLALVLTAAQTREISAEGFP